ncbi:MAG: hypothetical protein HKN27_07360 [Silicimonas sp.]|nr:hypothetical protein [Silicimonas sp.]
MLDISSSMNGSNRLTNLKTAMNEFITRVIPEDSSGPSTISVSIIPYSMTVNPGDMISSYYDIQGKHSYSSCVFFENTAFDTLAIDVDEPLERYSHYADGSSGYHADGTINLPYCPDNEILVHSTLRSELSQAVADLRGWDATGIDIGVKWGLHLLDPSFRPVLSDLASKGDRSADLINSPGAYSSRLVKKIMVLMSDGENDGQRDLVREEFREGPSPVWIDPDTGDYSVLVLDGRVTGSANTNDTTSRWYHEDSDDIEAFPDLPGASVTNWEDVESEMVRMDWPDVFNVAKSTHLANKFFRTAYEQGYIDQDLYDDYRRPYNNRISDAGPNGTIQRISDICTLAKNAGVEIFGISFDPPSDAAQEVISDCATSAAHFFPVEGLEISNAFAAIGQNISLLRLTN